MALGTAGAATYSGTLTAATGALSGIWNAGQYGVDTFTGHRN